jgi:hypothetical protein
VVAYVTVTGATNGATPPEGVAVDYPPQDRALVNVGVTHDTAEFAVESIRRWWRLMGRRAYPSATPLLISADAAGSNGNRLRVWKLHLP